MCERCLLQKRKEEGNEALMTQDVGAELQRVALFRVLSWRPDTLVPMPYALRGRPGHT